MEPNSAILKVLNAIQKAIDFHCELAAELLREVSGLELLHEYHKRWTAFISVAIKFDQVFLPLATAVNQTHLLLFPNFP